MPKADLPARSRGRPVLRPKSASAMCPCGSYALAREAWRDRTAVPAPAAACRDATSRGATDSARMRAHRQRSTHDAAGIVCWRTAGDMQAARTPRGESCRAARYAAARSIPPASIVRESCVGSSVWFSSCWAAFLFLCHCEEHCEAIQGPLETHTGCPRLRDDALRFAMSLAMTQSRSRDAPGIRVFVQTVRNLAFLLPPKTEGSGAPNGAPCLLPDTAKRTAPVTRYSRVPHYKGRSPFGAPLRIDRTCVLPPARASASWNHRMQTGERSFPASLSGTSAASTSQSEHAPDGHDA